MNFKYILLLLALVVLPIDASNWMTPPPRNRGVDKAIKSTARQTTNTFISNIKSKASSNGGELVISQTNLIKCVMLKETCDVDLWVKRAVDLTKLEFKSNADNIIVFVSVEFNASSSSSQNLTGYSLVRVKVKALLIGNATLTVGRKNEEEPIFVQQILVTAPRRPIDIVFDVWRWLFGSTISLLMGILLDKDSLLKIVKMPKAIGIGFCCQYIIMPLLAFSIAKAFSLPSIEALALFIYGCSPGGAGSNNWTIMFNGDLDLSVILTFVSTMMSLIAMPAWVYSLGTVFSTQANIRIPVIGLFGNLLITIVPCLIGFAIGQKFKKLKEVCLKWAKPFTLLVLVSFFTFLFLSKFYLLKLIRWRNWISGPFIPWVGYILGGGMAYLLGLPKSQCKTVAIETGIQNVGVAFLIIFTNLPSPEADYASLPIIAIATLTTLPLFVLYFVRKLYKIIRLKMSGQKADADESDSKVAEVKKEAVVVLIKENEEEKPMIEKPQV